MNEAAFYQSQLSKAVKENRELKELVQRLRNELHQRDKFLSGQARALEAIVALRVAVMAYLKVHGPVSIRMAAIDTIHKKDEVRAEAGIDEQGLKLVTLRYESFVEKEIAKGIEGGDKRDPDEAATSEPDGDDRRGPGLSEPREGGLSPL